MIIRAFYTPENKVMLLYLVRKLNEGETFTQALDTETARGSFKDLPYDDIDAKDFPDKTKKEKWRGEKGKGIWIDESIITPKEARKAKEDDLDAELAKPNADPVKVIRLNRELEKMKNAVAISQ